MKLRRVVSLFIVTCFLFLSNAVDAESLPEGTVWTTNNKAPVFASPEARKGGSYNTFILSFPLTLRQVGPDSNGSFRSYLDDNQFHLLYGPNHPNTDEILPELATHWAFADDHKTMYFKLDKRARWSDGKPVTADDYLFALEFFRSKNIVSPWHNNFFGQKIDKVVKYDDYTISISTTTPHPEVDQYANSLPPIPKHFYKGKVPKDFVRRYNWAIAPNTGPYIISKVRKGKSITFKRKKNWWAKDLRYYKGRFNVDRVVFTVIRDTTTAFEFFKKNRLDGFGITAPAYWHRRAKDLNIHNNGYVKKIWFYTDGREPAIGLWLNQDKEIFKDKNVRYAFGHAMNIEKMLNKLLRGDYGRLHTGTTGYGRYTNKQIRARPFDINKVESLMTESGWNRGKDGIWVKGNQRYSVTVTYVSELHTPRLALLKEQAKRAGIELKLQRLDASTSFKLALEKKHEVYWGGWAATDRPQYWGQFHSDNAHKTQTNNITNTNDPILDKLIDEYRSSLSIERRMELAREIQQKIFEIGSYIPTYKVGYFRTIYWRWWQFPKIPATKTSEALFEPFKMGLFWLDPDIKKETLAAMKNRKKFEPETIIDTTYKQAN
ncbi:MAG: extracellular solute-binding protein [Proteobacteria bacterium]|nr:extracellular solute-binding protein [Pseudomonadota bacterium]